MIETDDGDADGAGRERCQGRYATSAAGFCRSLSTDDCRSYRERRTGVFQEAKSTSPTEQIPFFSLRYL